MIDKAPKPGVSPRMSDLPCALSDRDIMFYNTYGFVILRKFLSPDEMLKISGEIEHAMHEQYSHRPYDGTGRHWSMMIEDDTPTLAAFPEDPRFLNIAKVLYGNDVLGAGSDANRMTGDTAWHRETGTVHQYGVKFAIYLDKLRADNGALRVLAGSHATADDSPLDRMTDWCTADEVPAYVCETDPGDVVAFDLRLWHGSARGGKDRRMCAVVYYSNPKDKVERDALIAQAATNPKTAFATFGCKRQYLYSKRWLSNPKSSAERQRWINRLREIGYYDQPGVAEGGTPIT